MARARDAAPTYSAAMDAGAASHPDAVPHQYRRRKRGFIASRLDDWAARRFFTRLIKRTNNFDQVTWLGRPVWQNVFDLCTIQQTIVELRPDVILETGTNRGGSALFYAHLFDLMVADGMVRDGRILTLDIEKLHALSHPRVTFLLGSSVDAGVVQQVETWLARTLAEALGSESPPRVMVILDSDHSRDHVRRELEIYSHFVSPGSYLLCQDGVMDVLPCFTRGGREGPLHAIADFIVAHPEFEIDHERCGRFLLTHHPKGWLRRRP